MKFGVVGFFLVVTVLGGMYWPSLSREHDRVVTSNFMREGGGMIQGEIIFEPLPTTMPESTPIIATATLIPPSPRINQLPSKPTPSYSSPQELVVSGVDEALSLINQLRLKNNIGVLNQSESSCQIAQERVAETVSNYSHSGLSAYVSRYGLGIGENLAEGYASFDLVLNAWMGSAVHRQTLLMQQWQHVCIKNIGQHLVAIFTT